MTFHDRHPLEGYRRLTFMMLDANVVAVSPRATYRVLRAAGRLDRWIRTPSRQGTGFVQPLEEQRTRRSVWANAGGRIILSQD